MQTFEFTPEEVEVLREVLQHCKVEMDLEVLHTDARDFRELLKRRREILGHILAKIPAAAIAA